MSRPERVIRSVDRFQQHHPVLAFPIAVVKKYGDDQSARLAALIAYYGFFSVFPLLLVFTSVLGFVLSGNPDLRQRIIDSALGQFPVIGTAIGKQADTNGLEGSMLSIVVGGATAIWAGMGVAQAAQSAMNTVWDIPRSDWPNFVFRRLRALAMLALLGSIIIVSTFISGFGSSGATSSNGLRVAGWCVVLLLNFVLFTVAYQVLTARDLKWRDVMPGAAVAALTWTVLQAAGGYVVTRQLQNASDVYGTFALVIALLVWISLASQVVLFCAELNVVRKRHLWPRSLVQPPLTHGDKLVYTAIARRGRMRPEVRVDVSFIDHPKQR